MPKVIIVGASSGIGEALARHYAAVGWTVGIMGRREERLRALARELGACCVPSAIDVRRTDEAMTGLKALIAALHPVDLIVMNAGVGHVNPELNWETERDTVATNVAGFAAVSSVAVRYFLKEGSGTFAGVSSVAGIRGVGGAPAYSASKAFVSNYLESLRGIVRRQRGGVQITEVRPGFVDTKMGQNPKAFWKASPERAAAAIARGITERRSLIYVTGRWRWIGLLLRVLPDAVVDRIG